MASGASSSVGNVHIDTTALRKLAADLRAVAPKSAAALRTGLRAAGEIVAVEARSRASFSTRIPGSIKVRTAGTTVKVQAGDDSAPNAAPIENHGKGHVRHPVFEVSTNSGGGGRYYGKRKNAPKAGLSRKGGIAPWTDKNSPPAFLAPAADNKEPETEEAVTRAIADAMRSAGFDLT